MTKRHSESVLREAGLQQRECAESARTRLDSRGALLGLAMGGPNELERGRA